MTQVSFGTALREARERRGMDINTAATRLRLRPDILFAIEDDDFSRLPPRGYTKNMVNAYARLVGLNPTDITQMYLDADYAYRAGNARSSSSRRVNRSRIEDAPSSSRSSNRESPSGRVMYDDRKEYRSQREFGARGGSSRHIYAGEHPRQSRHNALNSQYTNFYAGPAASDNNILARLPLIIGIIIILILLIIIISLVNCSGNNDVPQEAPKVPITGIDDTTGVNDSEPVQTKQKIVAPTSVTVVYEVSGDNIAPENQIYAVVNNNGTSEESLMTGPLKQEVQVSGLWSFGCWIPEAVTITVDGEPASFTTTTENGMPVCVVDFDSWLEGWYEAHPDAEKPGEEGSSDTTTTSNSADGASSSGDGTTTNAGADTTAGVSDTAGTTGTDTTTA